MRKSLFTWAVATALLLSFFVFAPAAQAGQPVITGFEINGGLSWPERTAHTFACGRRYIRVISDGPGPGASGLGTIEDGATMRLFKSGAPDIDVAVYYVDYYGPGQFIDGGIDIAEGTPAGLYSIEVTNPSGGSAVLADVLEVEDYCPRGRAGDLYVTSELGRNDDPAGQHPGNCACSACDNCLCKCNRDGNVIQYDGQTGEFVCVFASGGGMWTPHDMTWGPNGNLYVASLETTTSFEGLGSIIEYDGQTGDFVRKMVSAPSGSIVHVAGLAFGGPDANLFVLTQDGMVWTNPAYNRDCVLEFDGRTGAFIPHPSGVWNADLALFHPRADSDLYGPFFMRFGPDGTILMTSNNAIAGEPLLAEFDPLTGALIRTIITATEPDGRTGFVYERSTDTLLVVKTGGDEITRYDYATGALLETVISEPQIGPLGPPGALDGAWDAAWGPNGSLFVDGYDSASVWAPCYYDGCELYRRAGAIHEFDGQTFARLQVFGYGHYGEGEWDNKPRSGEVWFPRDLTFKPLPGDWGGDTAGGDWQVDSFDYGRFVEAVNGGSVNPAMDLLAFDFDRDADVDCDDWPAFQAAWTAGGSPPSFCVGYDPDPDGDGVHTDDDLCPNTPAGIPVDETGRPLADLDDDCAVDLTDFVWFQLSMAGPEVP
ncbi:MAG: hypothetical protein GY778_04670 [bacterium]|nr:hypothetical protein [bacterium]